MQHWTGESTGFWEKVLFEQILIMKKNQHVKIWAEEETVSRRAQLQSQLGMFEGQTEGRCGRSGVNEEKWFRMRLEGEAGPGVTQTW